MTLTMFDAVDVSSLPSGGDAYAGYVNGHWPTFSTIVKKFPHAKHLSIAVTAEADADCLDIEKGDATPADAPGWLARQWARGVYRPVFYCSQSILPDLLHALGKTPRASYRLWSAHYTIKHICSPTACHAAVACDGTQWNNKPYDTSLLLDGFFNTAPVPHSNATPLAPESVAALQTLKANLSTRTTPVQPGDGALQLLADVQTQIQRVRALA